MANFQNNAITESGILLRSHVDMGAVFTATRIVIGSGYIPAGKTARTMTDVVSPVKELAINKKERTPDGKVIFGTVYTNEDISKEFYFRELALYAKAVYPDGTEVEEVLYSYGNAAGSAELMAAYSTSTVVERQMDIVTFVGNEAKVDLTIASGVYVTAEVLARVAAPAPPTSGINLYVSPNGNDSTGDGTEAKPFRQIQKAIDSLPKNLGGQTAHIYIASGEYTSVAVEGFYGGNQSGGPNLRINSAGTDGIIINGYVRIRGCDVQVNFGKATVRGSTAGYDVIVYGCKYAALVGLTCADANSTKGIVIHSCSYVMVNGCTLSNKEIALEAYGGMVMAHALKGTNNACAIKSGNTDSGIASLVYVAYRSITATTLYTKVNGGLIFENGNEIDAVAKTGDQTMTGSLTMRTLGVTDGYMNGSVSTDGATSRVQVLARNPNTGKAGAVLVGPNGIDFMDGDGYEHRVIHEGNIGQFLGVAPASLE